MEDLQMDAEETMRLLNQTRRAVTRKTLLNLLASVQQTIAQYQQQQQQQQQRQQHLLAQQQLAGSLHQDQFGKAQNRALPDLRHGDTKDYQHFLPANDDTAYRQGSSLSSAQSAPDSLPGSDAITNVFEGQMYDGKWSSLSMPSPSHYGFGNSGPAAQFSGLGNALKGLMPPAGNGYYPSSSTASGVPELTGFSLEQEQDLQQQLSDLTLGCSLGNAFRQNSSGFWPDAPGNLDEAQIDSAESGSDMGALVLGRMNRAAQTSFQGQIAQMRLTSSVLQTPQAAQPVFRTLSTSSWEQSESIVKVYVPLRGVQTELLSAVFEHSSVEVKVINLKGKNYCFSITCTYRPINPSACLAVASKTKKNILITIKKLGVTSEDKHWQDLYRHR